MLAAAGSIGLLELGARGANEWVSKAGLATLAVAAVLLAVDLILGASRSVRSSHEARDVI